MRIDDFDGERVEVASVPTERLVDIRDQTVAAMSDPGDVTPHSVWKEQLSVIDEELGIRWDAAVQTLGWEQP